MKATKLGKDEVAERLAQIHYKIEPGMLEIYRLRLPKKNAENHAQEPIKLLEVNEDTVPTGIMPLLFGPIPERGIHYTSVIVEVTPREFQQIKAKRLKLPNGWTMGPLIAKANGPD